jgi:hypothetical protein
MTYAVGTLEPACGAVVVFVEGVEAMGEAVGDSYGFAVGGWEVVQVGHGVVWLGLDFAD